MQEELSSLMTRNLHLASTIPAYASNSSMPSTPRVLATTVPVTYTSQHYHHSGHRLRPKPSVSSILENAGIPSSALLPSQVQLFRNAPPDQQLRLIELWRIAPPPGGDQVVAEDPENRAQTSMEHEEKAGRKRWEAQERFQYKNLGVSNAISTSAEPYIVSGYDSTMTSMDGDMTSTEQGGCADMLIYQNSREWWRFSGTQPMEHQYGLLQHMQMYGQQLDQSGMMNDHDEEML